MAENNQEERKLTTEEVKLAIAEVISDIKKNREAIRLKSESGELKRNAFVNLDEKGILTPDNIVKEWDTIQARKSFLSSNQRKCVSQIVFMALQKAAIKNAMENKSTELNNQSNSQEQ